MPVPAGTGRPVVVGYRGAVLSGVSLAVPTDLDADVLRTLAHLAEEHRLAGLWLFAPHRGAPDAVTMAAATARWTESAAIGVVVDVAGGQAPAVVAKEISTLDRLSGGRAVLVVRHGPAGVGMGLLRAVTAIADYVAVCQAVLRRAEPAAPLAAGLATGRPLGQPPDRSGAVDRRPGGGQRWSQAVASDAPNLPPPLQVPGPPVVMAVGGRRTVLELAASYDAAVVSRTSAPALRRTRAIAAAANAQAAVGCPTLLSCQPWPSSGTLDRLVATLTELLSGPADGVVVALGPAAGDAASYGAPTAGQPTSGAPGAPTEQLVPVDLLSAVERLAAATTHLRPSSRH